ncbi:DUF805 domain-containing protein [Streptomyces sp. PTM05]|uniref:DUF805 domain-containing protein n=1 Tax=Streptantibioticus parmotrematis TaxID=2873249 RepID=A0ABS7R1P1_9ACTN|nr:DUF805 domain-containing protein [Streptantibioticus parmotrematis]MBY8889377.1 DUF805 domain-containing protein [Streptantibioticus parmotrematis]
MQWYLQALRSYADFSGRARRKEYWLFALFNFLILAVLYGVGLAVAKPIAILGVVYELGVLVPSLAVIWRRLHDTGRSGGWFFISLVPLVGGIILLVFVCSDSQAGANQYGPNPKEAAPYGYPPAGGYPQQGYPQGGYPQS